ADLVRLEHRVERRHFIDVYPGQAQVLGNAVHQFFGDVAAVLVLHRVQCADDGGALPPLGKARAPPIDLLPHVFRQKLLLAHRSISPKTMSCVPITATTSASMCPSTISDMADR